MKNNALYPLKFKPILREKVWGGNKLHTVLGKKSAGRIGESWELSGVTDFVSEVENGVLRGKTINQLIRDHGEALIGTKVSQRYGNEFPLLFKFLDASDDLSVQLHPNDALALERHNSFGKTEMWYIIDSEPQARLILRFNSDMDKDLYTKKLAAGEITSILHSEKIKKGDSFFLAPGTVHAIGAGTLLAEIQQTSDITYRIYDWDRPDSNGKMRELHTDLALEAIDFNAPDPKLTYEDAEDEVVNICTCEYFKTNKLNLSATMERSFEGLDSFVVYMCVEGKVEIHSNKSRTTVVKGETILIPAALKSLELKTTSATLLEVYIP